MFKEERNYKATLQNFQDLLYVEATQLKDSLIPFVNDS